MRVTHLKFKTHAMKPRVGTWRQVARKEMRMVSIDEAMGIECNSIRLQRTGTQAEGGKDINQGRKEKTLTKAG